jgi:hypothetical protein
VVAYVAEGQTHKLVGYQLGITTSAVSLTLQRAQKKLGVQSRADLLSVYALRTGIPRRGREPRHRHRGNDIASNEAMSPTPRVAHVARLKRQICDFETAANEAVSRVDGSRTRCRMNDSTHLLLGYRSQRAISGERPARLALGHSTCYAVWQRLGPSNTHAAESTAKAGSGLGLLGPVAAQPLASLTDCHRTGLRRATGVRGVAALARPIPPGVEVV